MSRVMKMMMLNAMLLILEWVCAAKWAMSGLVQTIIR
jgi:hypothetical protein